MKRMLLFALALCLGLAGCGGAGAAAGSSNAPVLPAPETPPLGTLETRPAEEPTDAEPWKSAQIVALEGADGTGPELLEAGDGTFLLRGPAGTVFARFFMGPACMDPLPADLDGDGAQELIYLCNGPTSGLFTQGICVYGLEEGWPVLKACSIYSLNWTDELGLEREGDQVYFRYTRKAWNGAKYVYDDLGPQRLAVTLRGQRVLLNDGELPEEIQSWGYPDWTLYGSSFQALRQRYRAGALLDHWACLIWPVPTVWSSVQPEGSLGPGACAAVSENGVTVTGLLEWIPQANGELFCRREGLEPIPPVEDPTALEGLDMETLTQKLGPCHFDMGSGLYIPCWFTEDGKLLVVWVMGRAELWDLLAGEPLFPQEDPDRVTVDSREIPTVTENLERWQRFVETIQGGQADAVTLRLIYSEGAYDLELAYDGSQYTLEDEGRSASFPHLIVDVETDPPARVKFHHAVHYLLSQDPEMTQQRYFAHMVSSAYQPEFPETRGLFSLYDTEP